MNKEKANSILTSTIHVPHLCFPLQLVHLDTDRYTLIPLSTSKSRILVPPKNLIYAIYHLHPLSTIVNKDIQLFENS
jgi:hypothetical protein